MATSLEFEVFYKKIADNIAVSADYIALGLAEITDATLLGVVNLGLQKYIISSCGEHTTKLVELKRIIKGILAANYQKANDPTYINPIEVIPLLDLPNSITNPPANPIVPTPVSEVTIDTIINDTNTGIYDKMSGKLIAELNNLYSKNRINSRELATIYSAGISAFMQQAIAFTTAKVQLQIESNKGNIQVAQASLELDMARVRMQVEHETNKIKLLNVKAKQAILFQQLQSEKAKTQCTLDGVPVAGTIGVAKDKIYEEIKVLKERLESERANTSDLRTDGAEIHGILGGKMEVLSKQANGFDRSHELNVAKLHAQAFNVQMTANSNTNPRGTGFTAAEIKDTLDHLKAGVGIQPRHGTYTPAQPDNEATSFYTFDSIDAASTPNEPTHGHTISHSNGSESIIWGDFIEAGSDGEYVFNDTVSEMDLLTLNLNALERSQAIISIHIRKDGNPLKGLHLKLSDMPLTFTNIPNTALMAKRVKISNSSMSTVKIVLKVKPLTTVVEYLKYVVVGSTVGLPVIK